MLNNENIFLKKKILIYGLGRSGLSTYQCLKKYSKIFLYDDEKKITKDISIKKKIIKYNDLINKVFDYIIISPGINIEKCILKNYLKKNLKKINTDLDIFYSIHQKNKNITITGTNGKSTTAKILYEVLRDQKFDVRLVGNIGNPILLEKNITNKTIFVVEASSYQLEYSKLFIADYAAILNITPDHLERHKTLNKYIKAKFKLIKNQTKSGLAFLNTKNLYIKNEIKKNKINSKIIRVNRKVESKFLDRINNIFFRTEGNKENLSFVIEISKKLNIKKKICLKL